MRIKRGPITFNNLISTVVKGDARGIFAEAQKFRNTIIQNGLYTVSPLIYKIQLDTSSLQLFLSLNQSVDVSSHSDLEFTPLLEFKDGLSIRHDDIESPFETSYQLLKEAAEAINVKIDEDFYHIHFSVFGEEMVDI